MRLFKRQFYLLASAVQHDPIIQGLTGRDLVRKSCWARNSQLMISGRSPLELAFGRKPREIIDVENANPEQLSVEPPLSDVRDQKLQRLALNAHNEARQLLDLRRDLARRL